MSKMEKSRLTYEERKAQQKGEYIPYTKDMKCNDIRSYVRNFRNKKGGRK